MNIKKNIKDDPSLSKKMEWKIESDHVKEIKSRRREEDNNN